VAIGASLLRLRVQGKQCRMIENGIAGIAFERAWRAYRLLNNKEDQHPKRRLELKRFVSRCCEHGATDSEAIVGLALIHLKQLDEREVPKIERRGQPLSGKNGTNDPASD
jgi:hypothetical protein